MPYETELQPDEQLLADIDFRVSANGEAFRFAVSDRALYLPATRLVVSGDPRYFKRVPLGEITEVRIEPIRPYGLYLLALVMVALGFLILGSILLPGATVTPRVFGMGLAIGVGGALLPLTARGRYRLAIQYAGGRFRWAPPLVVDRASRRSVDEVLTAIAKECARVGLRVSDARE